MFARVSLAAPSEYRRQELTQLCVDLDPYMAPEHGPHGKHNLSFASNKVTRRIVYTQRKLISNSSYSQTVCVLRGRSIWF
jgi:hypothetical protein